MRLRHLSKKIATLSIGMILHALSGAPLAWLGEPAVAQSPETPALSADIPAQPLAAALEVFARQTGLHVLYVSNVVRDQKSRAVAAGPAADEALGRLLQGTGLRFEFLTRHSVRILATAPQPGALTPGTADELQQYVPEVLVTGSPPPTCAACARSARSFWLTAGAWESATLTLTMRLRRQIWIKFR